MAPCDLNRSTHSRDKITVRPRPNKAPEAGELLTNATARVVLALCHGDPESSGAQCGGCRNPLLERCTELKTQSMRVCEAFMALSVRIQLLFLRAVIAVQGPQPNINRVLILW